MALKALMLRKKINDAKAALENARAKDADFEKREAEIEASINEAETEEEKQAVEEAVASFETEKEEHENEKANLEKEVGKLEAELEEIEKEQPEKTEEKEEKREVKRPMVKRTKFFGMDHEERDAFFAREDVKDFLARTRELAINKRSVNGANLLIPTVVLDVIRENVINYSKLYSRVRVRQVPGKARQVVMGAIPEAVWTEMCGALNEIDLSFGGVEVDGYKVGGYVAVCNAMIEDADDAELATEVIEALSQAIGRALDKAILFGTGTKMPLGIVTRLLQTADTDTNNTIPWVDIHETNAQSMPADALNDPIIFFRSFNLNAAFAKGKYSRGEKFWAMNEVTYAYVKSLAISANAEGAYVSMVDGKMPVVGGDIIVLDFIPDHLIVGGYGDLYLLAERAGTSIERSEHAMFVEDQTVFKGTARYDGLPVIAEGFVAMALSGSVSSLAGTVTFAPDSANTPAGD